jgi:chromosome segregation protein
LDAIPKFNLTLPKIPGIVGVLSDYVTCDDDYSALKTFLFGNIVLADTRKTAYKISQMGYKTVTTNGEYFEAKGGTVVIDINSKISKLTKLISMSSDIDGLFQSINLIKKYVQKKKHSLKKLDDSIQSYTERLSISENSLTSTNENYSNLKSRITSAISIKGQLTKRISELTYRTNAIESEVKTTESYVESLQQRIAIVE